MEYGVPESETIVPRSGALPVLSTSVPSIEPGFSHVTSAGVNSPPPSSMTR